MENKKMKHNNETQFLRAHLQSALVISASFQPTHCPAPETPA
jgi:hypothetical protein